MPTNKLWLEHTERAAWDSVEALRERLLKAESRLEALTPGVGGVPRVLDVIEDAKRKHAPAAQGYEEVVLHLVARVEQLQAELQAAKTREPAMVSFAVPVMRPRLDSDELDEGRGAEHEELELGDFTQAMQRSSESRRSEPARDLNRLLSLAEDKVDDLTELEGAGLREAALELALLAAKIYAASRSRD